MIGETGIIPLKLRELADVPVGTRIVAAAIAEGCDVYTGMRHSSILADMKDDGLPPGSRLDSQGFVDQHGFWYNRADSQLIAHAAGQVVTRSHVLTSEDLWDIDGNEYYPDAYALWLDDKRPVPHHFEWRGNQNLKLAVCTTAEAAIDILCKYNVVKISLDHDLGDEATCGTGYEVASFIEEAAFEGRLAPLDWAVHSQNPVGAKRMHAALFNADLHWSKRDNSL